MTKKRFPGSWATAEIVKQYMKNHRRHAVCTGRMKPRSERRLGARIARTAADQEDGFDMRRNIDEEVDGGKGSGDEDE